MPDSLWQDVRFAARSLRLNPGYAGIALLTLAVGIGANAAIFSVVNAYLLRPLPLEEPNRIISLSKVKDGNTGPTSAPNFLDYREQSSSFEDLVGIQLWATTLTGVDTPRRLSLAMVTPGFFQVLGAQPTLGRGFVSEESIEGQHRSVVLSHEAWSSSFGSDVTVLGRSVLLNGESYELVGVAPRGLRVPPFTSDVYVPLAFADDALDARGRNNIFVLGRLADEASMASASAEMDVIAQGLSDTYPRANEGWGIRIEDSTRSQSAPHPGACGCCWAPSGSCCSSRASTWRASPWLEEPRGAVSWLSGWPSGRREPGSSGNCSGRVYCSRS